MDLGRNALAGALLGLGVLSRLTELRSLWLHENVLEGPLELETHDSFGWMSCLSNLEQLVLYGNRFSGAIPASIGTLEQLRLLMLDRNLFTGVVPASIFALPNVEDLLLFRNDLRGIGTDDWRRMRSLRNVMLQDNHRLQGRLPELPSSIEKLDLRNCQFSGAFPAGWSRSGSGLPKLRAMYLSSSRSKLLAACETWAIVSTCDQRKDDQMLFLPSLTLLDLSDLPLACPVQVILRAFGHSPLSTVRLRATQLSGTLDQSAFHMSFVAGTGCYEGPGTFYETLASLDLSENRLNSLRWDLFPFERPPPALQMLSLANNALSSVDPEWLIPSQIVLTGNPSLRSALPASADAMACARFWYERLNGGVWNAEGSWDPCIWIDRRVSECPGTFDGFAVQRSGAAVEDAETLVLSMPRSVSVDPHVCKTWAKEVPQTGPGLTTVAHPDLKAAPHDHARGELTELGASRVNLLRLGLSPVAVRAVRTAIDLGIPQLLDSKPRTCRQLAASISEAHAAGGTVKASQVHERLCRYLRALAALGLIGSAPSPSSNSRGDHESDLSAFVANPATALMRDTPSGPADAPPFKAFFEYEKIFDRYMTVLADTIRTGRTGPDLLYGHSGDESIFHVSDHENVLFDRAFSAIETRQEALDAIPWPKDPFHLCDVGGGAGVDADLLLKMEISADITIFDIQFTERSFARPVESVLHDMFQPLPSRYVQRCDFFWLDFVIQDFGDDKIASMFRHLRVAAPPSARLALLNHVLDAHESGGELERFKREMDLWQMVALGGRERSREDFRRLLAAGGWRLDGIELIDGEACVIVASAIADWPTQELDSIAAQMPGPWIGPAGSRRALVVWAEMSSASPPSVAILPGKTNDEGRIARQTIRDMDFIGIWESVLPLAQDKVALFYCSKSLKAPAAAVAHVVRPLTTNGSDAEELRWLGEPSSFLLSGAGKSSRSLEHFFAEQAAVELPCAMRISAATLPPSSSSEGRILACHVVETPSDEAGAQCSLGSVESGSRIAWAAPVNLYSGVMSEPCSNLPMHRFATLKVVAFSESSWLVFYTDGALIRGGGRCDGKALEAESRCAGANCELYVRRLRLASDAAGGLELGEPERTPLPRLHMLDAAALGSGEVVVCFAAQPHFPGLQDDGRCVFAAAANREGGEKLPLLRFGPSASLGYAAWDIAVAALDVKRRTFAVAFEDGEREKRLLALVGVITSDGQVQFDVPIAGGEPLRFLSAQRPSIAALSAEEFMLVAADQAVNFQPVVVSMKVTAAGQNSNSSRAR
eukprot:TRINITY_DN27548_c0_g2_i2.p1 TRINITY_DN27548_c0_g2~~TRINITY_DN27548_c0_g2_i2.p1  ORF type:complete len:1487 (+),score=260.70 TRINITY_DN27548_c0_g2_i2:620-4462(+)